MLLYNFKGSINLMISINFLILVPPMIMQQKENADIVAREGDNVTLACDARGHPRPQVVWRREDKEDILVNGRKGIINQLSAKSVIRLRVYVQKIL